MRTTNNQTKGAPRRRGAAHGSAIPQDIVFAWLPKPISEIRYDKYGAWITPTGKTAWLQRVIHKYGIFDDWYELPNDQAEPQPMCEVNRDSGTGAANGCWLQRSG
jgi:hypothetical protein